ncbi:protein FLOURY ENDOSPERM 6, chloroplastic-like [Zingiber officinale]|uniref:protein FLOURY ENDOSPERM 6, chloroplastic-like n=1 Tax=Zingiber officinale TaxID=94328 RepID=UPI001C4AC483|nr:protein FLOURY ENDOSPERM 6, chloroplastic-like [Zingiber officinale]
MLLHRMSFLASSIPSVFFVLSSASLRRSRPKGSPSLLLHSPFSSSSLPSSWRYLDFLPPNPFGSKVPFLWLSDTLRWSKRCTTGDENGASGVMRRRVELEAQIYEFMRKAGNLDAFPTREELIAAGRSDLVEAISFHGGWLAFGWRHSEYVPIEVQEVIFDGSWENDAVGDSVLESEEELSVSSSSGRLTEIESAATGGGIEGMLRRLETLRILSLADFKEIGRASSRDDKHVLDRAGHMVPSDSVNNKALDCNVLDKDTKNQEYKHSQNSAEMSKLKIDSEFGNSEIGVRFKQLESDLASTLKLLRSRINVSFQEGQQSSMDEMHKLSDALEYQETDIINARDKLRSIRARMAVLEGKMTLEIISTFYRESKKLVGEKQKKLDSAQITLSLLRSVCIIWSNSASEVLLVGSFDGWTNQRRMESSSSGIFSLYLKLYPGSYEIKFIVDGVWKVDPLRPITRNDDGNENNLLIIT